MIAIAVVLVGGAAFGGVAATTGGDAARTESLASTTTEQSTSAEDQLLFSVRRWSTDSTRATVSLAEFVPGGPGKDGVPAIDEPEFISVDEAAGWIEPCEPVIEVVTDGEARIYPVQCRSGTRS